VRHWYVIAVAIHISPNNGPIEMIPSVKLVVDVLETIAHFMKIGPVLMMA
jgi:hypothetical protein